jgi:hypothetical protein
METKHDIIQISRDVKEGISEEVFFDIRSEWLVYENLGKNSTVTGKN